ncbi:MAG: hypothetical protein KAR06_04860 [Deltaproteobacteria bacterium]|nr:hypothetical protein [Deltaproteobacteria bacterium]
MNNKAVEKIADFCRERYNHDTAPDWERWARGILQANLSDPDIPIIEIDPDAELPLLPAEEQYKTISGVQTSRDMEVADAQARWMLKDGWKKEKK